MSVIVKGMELPSECEYCGFCRYYPSDGSVWCNATNKLLKMNWENPDWTHLDVKRPEWCPLVELPERHGRLIDADELKKEYGMKDDCTDCEKELRGKVKSCQYDVIYSKMDFCGWIDDQPTVIEEENGT